MLRLKLSLYPNKIKTQPPISFIYSGMTHKGLVRSHNEDSYTCIPDQNLWVVADGMGGHESGDFASRTITSQAEQFTQQNSLEDSILLLEENFQRSNEIIRQKAETLGDNITIGSTLSSLYVWNNLAFVLWAGDSRVYRFRDQTLQRLTEDHSFVEELVRMGKLDPEQAEAHPASNVVLNAIGIEAQLLVDMEYYKIQDRDLYLLCSDGLYKDLTDGKIIEILTDTQVSIKQLNQRLIDAALHAGGTDNCTVVLVKAEIEDKDV